jgi:hypothetical protein
VVGVNDLRSLSQKRDFGNDLAVAVAVLFHDGHFADELAGFAQDAVGNGLRAADSLRSSASPKASRVIFDALAPYSLDRLWSNIGGQLPLRQIALWLARRELLKRTTSTTTTTTIGAVTALSILIGGWLDAVR